MAADSEDLIAEVEVATMNFNGYAVVSTSEPPELMVTAVENSVGRAELYSPKASDIVSTYFYKRREEFDAFIDYDTGRTVSIIGSIYVSVAYWHSQFRKHFEDTLNVPYDRRVEQGPILAQFIPKESEKEDEGKRIKTAHPSAHAMSVFRPLRYGLGPENGMFEVFPGSQFMSYEQLINSDCKPDKIRLQTHECLIIWGRLWIKESIKGGGNFMWKGFSRGPIVNFDQYSLHFMQFG
jgi:hypothetical protein